MKKSVLLLIPVLITAAAAFADKVNDQERVYVMTTKNASPVEDILVDCAWTNQFMGEAVVGIKSDLYSVQSKKTSGVLLNDAIKKIGEALDCLDMGSAQIERGVTPVYDFGEAWMLTVEGQLYIVIGMARIRTNPATNPILVPGGYLGVSSGTVFTPESLALVPPVPVGSFASNFLANIAAPGQGAMGEIVTLRIYPRE